VKGIVVKSNTSALEESVPQPITSYQSINQSQHGGFPRPQVYFRAIGIVPQTNKCANSF